jgi:DNA-binding transcriptional MerR regulator
MSDETTYTVGQLARLGGVSTKTLRHYDRIGLLVPSRRSDANYRLYSEVDGQKLTEILAYRALGLSLDEVSQILEGGERVSRLSAHLSALRKEQQQLEGLIRHIETIVHCEKKGTPMNVRDELNGFANNPYEDEAREKWGDSDAWQVSQQRVKGYGVADWERYKAEAADINERFVALMSADVPADSAEACLLAEEHRQLISRWFYDCSPDMHAGFGDMWEADPRFKKNIDKDGEGLSDYMAVAFRAAAKI